MLSSVWTVYIKIILTDWQHDYLKEQEVIGYCRNTCQLWINLMNQATMFTVGSRLENVKIQQNKMCLQSFRKPCCFVYSLSNSCHICVNVHVCICKLQPLLWCQPVLSSIPEMEKEMLAPDSQSALFLGRTYNYSNECIQKQHIS